MDGNFSASACGQQPLMPYAPPSDFSAAYDHWFLILGEAWNAIHAGHLPTDKARHLIAGRCMAPGNGKNLMSKAPDGWRGVLGLTRFRPKSSTLRPVQRTRRYLRRAGRAVGHPECVA